MRKSQSSTNKRTPMNPSGIKEGFYTPVLSSCDHSQ